jgi:hypothetical protein
MSRVKWTVLACVVTGAGFVLASPSANADDARFVGQPAVFRVGSTSGGVTTQLVNHRYGGGGFSIGIYSGPRYGYGGYGGGGYYGGGYGGYYRPSYGYGYSPGFGGYPPGFNPGGYYYSAPSYGYGNYGYGGYYRGGWGCY